MAKKYNNNWDAKVMDGDKLIGHYKFNPIDKTFKWIVKPENHKDIERNLLGSLRH